MTQDWMTTAKEFLEHMDDVVVTTPLLYLMANKIRIEHVDIPLAIPVITRDSRIVTNFQLLHQIYIEREDSVKRQVKDLFALSMLAAMLAVSLRHNTRRLDEDIHIWTVASNLSTIAVLQEEYLYPVTSHHSGLVEEVYRKIVKELNTTPNQEIEKTQKIRYTPVLYDLIKGYQPSSYKIYYTFEEALETSIASGITLRNGDSSLYNEKLPTDVIDRMWVETFLDAYYATMGAGRLALERDVDRLTKSGLNWMEILKNEMKRVANGPRIIDWGKPSRRFGYSWPGYRRITKPYVWALIDVSGSISKEELTKFLSEAYSIISYIAGEMTIIFWEDGITGVEKIRKKSDIKQVMQRVKGGGGTQIEEALRYIAEHCKQRDTVIIFSDGQIYDWEEDHVQSLLTQVARKTGKIYFVSTCEEPIHPKVFYIPYRKLK